MKKKSIGLSTIIASSIRKLSLSLLMLGCLSNPSWGQTNKAEIVGNPTVNEDEVTIRVKVTREDGRPIVTLQDTDFSIKVNGEEINQLTDWKSPEDRDNIQPPAWIIVLLDFSGSMQQKDSRGTTRLQGAINAIREFINLSAKRGSNIQVSIVPFGEGGHGCAGDRVDNKTLDRFLSAGDFKLQNYLDTLETRTPCASTNLYEPLNRAVRFLANTQDPRFHLPKDSKDLEPRLSIIFLSDGYSNYSYIY
ncbi:VWA domain-containing protein [Pleurocapsales cyanobacterium LEGE 06147]|nr:VWA domain-containing protein [Pleurocapsales cyanobacterium LEGE 06147]